MQENRYIALACLAWTCAITLSGVTTINNRYQEMLAQLRSTAVMAYEKDLAHRRWNTMRGGVYVEMNEANPPNPYLDVPNRDYRTVEGKILTLVNPAYMARQVHELQRHTADVQGHITSLKPIRPDNLPDDWERSALEAFERGASEFTSRAVVEGREYLRYMRPMLTEEPCLKCHAKQGYKEGDIRGGISVSVPMDGQLAMLGTHLAETAGGHALIWALGMGGLVLGGRRLSRSIRETDQARVAAESANVAKSTFLATMSHEIRTPMSGVMGMLQLLKSTPLDQEQGQYVDLALQSSRYLLHILSDILDLSRIEAGALALRDEPFDGDDLVKPVVGALELEANGKGLALSVAMDRRLSSRLRGDAGRIRQVLFNLVGNAIKYTEQGQVRLELNLLPHRRASGQVCLHIVVADTGIGIPDGILHTVFEPFTQVDGSSTRRQGGAGLGLSIVKRLVGLMGGTLAVSSEPGRGTEVHVSLWLGTEAGEEHVAKPDGQAGASARRKILVAEDEAINRLAVVRRLEQLGCDAGQAVNGQEALALLGRETFDAVLMDVQMPIMSGIEATRRIRSGEVGSIDPNIPIIALTAYAMSGDREKFMEAGMDAYLSKPVDMDELIQILAAIKPSAP